MYNNTQVSNITFKIFHFRIRFIHRKRNNLCSTSQEILVILYLIECVFNNVHLWFFFLSINPYRVKFAHFSISCRISHYNYQTALLVLDKISVVKWLRWYTNMSNNACLNCYSHNKKTERRLLGTIISFNQ